MASDSLAECTRLHVVQRIDRHLLFLNSDRIHEVITDPRVSRPTHKYRLTNAQKCFTYVFSVILR